MNRLLSKHTMRIGKPATTRAAVLVGLLCLPLTFAAAQERTRPPGAKPEGGAAARPAAPGKPGAERSPAAGPGSAGDSREQLRAIDESWMREIHGQPAAGQGAAANEAGAASGQGAPANGPAQRFRNPPQDEAASGERATEAAPAAPLFAGDEEGPSFFSVIFRFLGLAALMILVLYAGLRLIRNRAGPLMGAGELVQVVATIPLMQGRFLQIVDLAGQLLVLGVSDSGVSLVAEVDDARVGDRIRLWQAERARMPSPAGMLEQLTGILKKTEFSFWHSENKPGRPGFKDWLSKYAPATAGATAGTSVGGAPADPTAGIRLSDIPVDADQESLAALLKSQRQKLESRKSRI